MKGGGLIAGGLLAVIALIIYEQFQKNAIASMVIVPGMPTPITALENPSPGATVALTPGSSPSTPQSPLTVAAQSLPKFSEGVDPSVVDFGVSPSFNGTEWTCPNGDIPYYDPATQTVYCVLPGMRVSVTPVIGDDLTESMMSGGVL